MMASLSLCDELTDLSILAAAGKLNGVNGALLKSVGMNVDGVAASIPMLAYPPRSQIKRQKMTYHCKFGEFGVMEGQFTEPSGVAVNAQCDIIVADTNNHRIQVGQCGINGDDVIHPFTGF